ncbi:MAG TPA: hypothetical protein VLJ58_06075 [Ramlibacter sp.]|nr:hypothetical protein [Ramlibacter sp.]
MLQSIHSFGELSNFLRGAMADEDSRELSESMSQLAAHVEAIVASLRGSQQRATIAPMLVDLLTVLRTHRNLVVGLAPPWRSLHEYAGYVGSLNQFRVLTGQWLLDGGPRSSELQLSAEDFELVAWRTLAQGLLLIDMYEQLSRGVLDGPHTMPPDTQPSTSPPQAEHWWNRLRR